MEGADASNGCDTMSVINALLAFTSLKSGAQDAHTRTFSGDTSVVSALNISVSTAFEDCVGDDVGR